MAWRAAASGPAPAEAAAAPAALPAVRRPALQKKEKMRRRSSCPAPGELETCALLDYPRKRLLRTGATAVLRAGRGRGADCERGRRRCSADRAPGWWPFRRAPP